jgi:hypothetical protein
MLRLPFGLYLQFNSRANNEKNVLFFLLIFFTQNSFAQENLSWQGYFSYTEIKDLSASTTQVFAASENALFSKNLTTNVVKTTIPLMVFRDKRFLHYTIAQQAIKPGRVRKWTYNCNQ